MRQQEGGEKTGIEKTTRVWMSFPDTTGYYSQSSTKIDQAYDIIEDLQEDLQESLL
ncbi:unnamed protein product [Amoebophrya sp. A25]|nr:unnamed protein product [Amoebophrya sp. A25]|eukprot:GSA25T00003345001.1